MNRISVNLSDELNVFFKNLSKKNKKSVSKICSEYSVPHGQDKKTSNFINA